MAQKTKTFACGEHRYEMRQLGGMLAAELSVTVLNVVSGMLPLILAAGSFANMDVSKVNLDWGKIQPLVKAFSEHTFLVGKAGKQELHEVFDVHFAGDLDGILELVLQGIELNYASFLAKRLGFVLNVSAMRVAPSASESPTD